MSNFSRYQGAMNIETKPLSPVAQLLKSRGIRQSDVAAATRESKQNVSKLWYGQTQMSKKWALRLEEILKMDWFDIMKLGDSTLVLTPEQAAAPDLAPTTGIQELAVHPEGGGGTDDMPLDGNGNHVVVAEWRMPTDYLRSYASTTGESIKIVRIAGDSMEPEYPAGERVMVDTSHRMPSPPGIYVLWDGFGLILKRLEYIYGSKPPVVRIQSINPAYQTYEKPLDDVIINGRVIGKWMWK